MSDARIPGPRGEYWRVELLPDHPDPDRRVRISYRAGYDWPLLVGYCAARLASVDALVLAHVLNYRRQALRRFMRTRRAAS